MTKHPMRHAYEHRRPGRLTDRFLASLANCPDMETLHELLLSAINELGFSHFALVHHAALRRPGTPYAWLHNYPSDWLLKIDRQAEWDDPVHMACRLTGIGFSWDRMPGLASLSAAQRLLLKECRHYGIGDGYTVPFHIPGEPAGSCSFAVRPGEVLPSHRLRCAEIIAMQAFDAARRLIGDVLRPHPPHLSRRERECLKWVARGKSDWEISVILGISAETARQYVKRARSAYHVSSRTQLVVLGLRDNWLGYDEAAL